MGVDVAPIDPPLQLENVVSLTGDLSDPAVVEQALEAAGRPADVLLCDAAPKLTGVRARDRAEEEALLEAVERALPRLLRPGGDFLVKLLESPEAQVIDHRLRARFARAGTVKTQATRRGSSERYMLGRGLKAGRDPAPSPSEEPVEPPGTGGSSRS